MKNIFLVFLACSSLFLSCHKQCPAAIPSCLSAWIDVVKKQDVWNPAAEVHEYLYKGRRVFLLSANCCDQYITLIDEQCNYICAPSGGIAGKGDRLCPGFYEQATYTSVVWKDQR
jgi:hypothetical protein